jgi:hypothetical protein
VDICPEVSRKNIIEDSSMARVSFDLTNNLRIRYETDRKASDAIPGKSMSTGLIL